MYTQLFFFVTVFFAAIGFARGLIKEILGLIGILLLFYINVHFGDEVLEMFLQSKNPLMKIFFNCFLFLVSFILISALNSITIKSLKGLNFNLLFDHVGGIFIGAAKGLMLILILTIPFIFGADSIERNVKKYDIILPDSLLLDKKSLFLNLISILQGKFIKITDIQIEKNIDHFFDTFFKADSDDEQDRKDEVKKHK